MREVQGAVASLLSRIADLNHRRPVQVVEDLAKIVNF